jgi:hypothetical protein
MVAVAEVIQRATEIMETLEAWAQATEIKTAEVLVAEEDLTTDRVMAQAVAAVEQQAQALMQGAQQFKMELVHLLAKEDLVGDLEHQVVELAHLITGLHGLVLAVAEETVRMELQAEAEAEDQQEVEDLVAEAQGVPKQQTTQVEQAWTEQVQAAVEIITQVEMVKREVLA